jgi:NTE family protein
MVFGGGLGLAAYHAGVFEAFVERGGILNWAAGSSAGAVTAALIAGNHEQDRIEKLHAFWNCPPVKQMTPAFRSHLGGWMGAIGTRLLGSTGHFQPRLLLPSILHSRSLYDLSPMKSRIFELVDFGKLNSGDMRVTIAATDVESGEPVIFDSARERIEMDHILASCGFLPEFAPVEIGDRLLADGGLSLNVPFDPILEEDDLERLLIYIVDLYPRDGERPQSLEAALERKSDLIFSNQTIIRLRAAMEARRLRRQIAGNAGGDGVVLLSYRPGTGEAGPEKSFDLSASGLAQRWIAGRLDMREVKEPECHGEIIVIRRGRSNRPLLGGAMAESRSSPSDEK